MGSFLIEELSAGQGLCLVDLFIYLFTFVHGPFSGLEKERTGGWRE